MLHLDEGTLHALVDGEIPSSDLPPLQNHLAACASCRTALEEARALAGETRDLVETLEVPVGAPRHLATGDAIRARPARSVPWHRLAWAATVVVAVGLGYGARDLLPPPSAPDDPIISRVVQDDSAGPPPAPVSPRPEPPSDAFVAPRPPQERRETKAKEEKPPPESSTREPTAKATGEGQPPAAPNALRRTVGGNALDALSPQLRDQPATPVPARPVQLAESRRDAPVQDLLTFRGRASAAAEEDALTLDEAMRWSTGRLRLLPDLVPAGLSRRGDTLQITYLLGTRVVVLEEIFHPDTVLLRLRAAADFPADSLAALRARLP